VEVSDRSEFLENVIRPSPYTYGSLVADQDGDADARPESDKIHETAYNLSTATHHPHSIRVNTRITSRRRYGRCEASRETLLRRWTLGLRGRRERSTTELLWLELRWWHLTWTLAWRWVAVCTRVGGREWGSEGWWTTRWAS